MKKYTEDEALQIIFDAASPSGLGKLEYDKIISYKLRYQKGKLGQRAIRNLLTKYGFEKESTITYYTKERTLPTPTDGTDSE